MKQQILYTGKVKTLYACDRPGACIVSFSDLATAFNGKKKENFKQKGFFNNHINAFLMKKLEQQEIPTHFMEVISDQESLVKKLEMIPVECVLRNRAAGSLCQRLGIPHGTAFKPPIFEFFFKSDALGDPLINECHILTFGWATAAEIEQMKKLTFSVNEVLLSLFEKAGMDLIDFKLEFGRDSAGKLLLADEISPDGCRIWDRKTGDILDKDRFRKDLGNVMEAYRDVADRLGALQDAVVN